MQFTLDSIPARSVDENAADTGVAPTLSGDAPIGEVTYSLSGDDAAQFTVDANGVAALNAQDFENPADANGDNTYEAMLVAEDTDGNQAQTAIEVTVQNVAEVVNFEIAPISLRTVDENAADAGETPVLTGDAPIGAVTYSLSGADAAQFSMDAVGVVTLNAQDFENPVDANADNTYEAMLVAEDTDGNQAQTAVEVTVQNVAEVVNFTIDSIPARSVDENAADTSVAPTLSGDAPIGEVTYSLQGADAAQFSMDAAGVVTLNAQDFENPADTDADGVYEVNLDAVDEEGNQASTPLQVVVTDVEEPANFTLADISRDLMEGATDTGSAPVLSGDAPIGDVTYSIAGDDAAQFTMDADGVVTLATQDFEAPADANQDNVYVVMLTATDEDGNTASANVEVTVTDDPADNSATQVVNFNAQDQWVYIDLDTNTSDTNEFAGWDVAWNNEHVRVADDSKTAFTDSQDFEGIESSSGYTLAATGPLREAINPVVDEDEGVFYIGPCFFSICAPQTNTENEAVFRTSDGDKLVKLRMTEFDSSTFNLTFEFAILDAGAGDTTFAPWSSSNSFVYNTEQNAYASVNDPDNPNQVSYIKWNFIDFDNLTADGKPTLGEEVSYPEINQYTFIDELPGWDISLAYQFPNSDQGDYSSLDGNNYSFWAHTGGGNLGAYDLTDVLNPNVLYKFDELPAYELKSGFGAIFNLGSLPDKGASLTSFADIESLLKMDGLNEIEYTPWFYTNGTTEATENNNVYLVETVQGDVFKLQVSDYSSNTGDYEVTYEILD